MKKRAILFMIFCLCFCLCSPGATVSAASGNTQTSTKTTKKVTTRKVTMKKAAKKSATKTKKTTAKKKVTKINRTVTFITVTTTVTTVKTTTKKKSKVKTIKTTVVTTVKTTKVNGGTNGAAGNSSTIGFPVSDLSDIKGHVDKKVYNAFCELGFTFCINPSLPTTGRFSVREQNIQLKRGYSSYLIHELGHFLSIVKGHNAYIDETDTFKAIYEAEKNAYQGNNKRYVTSDTSEYFAESFRDYTEDAAALKRQRPRTYDYIHKAVSSLSGSDITAFRNACRWMWE